MHHTGTRQSARRTNDKQRFKPFSPDEARAKWRSEHCLAEAQFHAAAFDSETAVRCCMAALRHTYGIPRYLMVRDRVDDLLARIDPLRMIRERLLAPEKGCMSQNSRFGSVETRYAILSD